MPTIMVLQFSGKYPDWAPFKDMFTAFLKHDPKLKDVEHLYFLKKQPFGRGYRLNQKYSRNGGEL